MILRWPRFSLRRALLATVAAAIALAWWGPSQGMNYVEHRYEPFKFARDQTRIESQEQLDDLYPCSPYLGGWGIMPSEPHQPATWKETRVLLAERKRPLKPQPPQEVASIRPFETRLLLIASYGPQLPPDLNVSDIVLVRRPRQSGPLAEMLERPAPADWPPYQAYDSDGADLVEMLRRDFGIRCEMEPLEAFEFLQQPLYFPRDNCAFLYHPISLDQAMTYALANRAWRYEVLSAGVIRFVKSPKVEQVEPWVSRRALRAQGRVVLVEIPALPCGEAEPAPFGFVVPKGALVWVRPWLWDLDVAIALGLMLLCFLDRIVELGRRCLTRRGAV